MIHKEWLRRKASAHDKAPPSKTGVKSSSAETKSKASKKKHPIASSKVPPAINPDIIDDHGTDPRTKMTKTCSSKTKPKSKKIDQIIRTKGFTAKTSRIDEKETTSNIVAPTEDGKFGSKVESATIAKSSPSPKKASLIEKLKSKISNTIKVFRVGFRCLASL